MKIVVLDASTLGDDLSLSPLEALGDCEIHRETKPDEVKKRIDSAEVVVLNKIKLNETNLKEAENLKLICVTATGYDNIDIEYCRKRNIAVCNVAGYSSHSVSQLTVATVLALSTFLVPYNGFVKSGEYSKSKVANRLTPVYHELNGKTWGVVGLGNIGKEVYKVAEALGCRMLACKRTYEERYNCTDIDALCRESDVITIHTPLSAETKNLIDEKRISLMKKGVILVNVARGAVVDEKAVAEAVKNGQIGAFGSDVYSEEPFGENHPFSEIMNFENVILTPHMAWGAYEARKRCLDEVISNIKAFYSGEIKQRVDI